MVKIDYYQSVITQKSWQLLQALQKGYSFILIGGWAVFLYTKGLKSKDIDIIVDYQELGKLQREFPLVKNERLKKYEIKKEEIDIDVYVPFYSDPGLPVEAIQRYLQSQDGFRLPKAEVVLILKQNVYRQRQFSAKGQKDRLDILALVSKVEINYSFYQQLLKEHRKEALKDELGSLLRETSQVPELNLNVHQFSRLKKTALANLQPR